MVVQLRFVWSILFFGTRFCNFLAVRFRSCILAFQPCVFFVLISGVLLPPLVRFKSFTGVDFALIFFYQSRHWGKSIYIYIYIMFLCECNIKVEWLISI